MGIVIVRSKANQIRVFSHYYTIITGDIALPRELLHCLESYCTPEQIELNAHVHKSITVVTCSCIWTSNIDLRQWQQHSQYLLQ